MREAKSDMTEHPSTTENEPSQTFATGMQCTGEKEIPSSTKRKPITVTELYRLPE